MEDINKNIGDNLSALRKEKGLTQLALAETFNYSDKAISKWEKGESLPSIDVLKRLADFYNVSLDYLTERKHETDKVNNSQDLVLRSNKTIITLLSICCVWTFATIIFVLTNIMAHINIWQTFVWAVPCSLILCIIFTCIWQNKKHLFVFISLLVWTILVALYLQLLTYNIWPVFIIGVPAQIAIVLWANIKPKNKKKMEK